MNTMVMNSAFSAQARMAAGVAFHTHHVVAVFQMKKVRNESQNNLPLLPCAMLSSNNKRGTNPMKINGAMPQVGQAAVSNPALNSANMIRRPLPSCPSRFEVCCAFLFAMIPKIRAKVRKNLAIYHLLPVFWEIAHHIKKSTIFAKNST